MRSQKLLKDYYPNYLKDWDDSKNLGVDKNKISIGSSRILISWKCHQCGYEWNQKIDRRVLHKTECKVCSRKDKLLKFNNPNLFEEIDRDKNRGIDINNLTSKSSKKIWWICKNGHSWYQNIDTRVKSGSSCKYCKSSKQSIVITHPELIKEWDYKKNIGVDPNFLTKGSNKKVWWVCNNCNNSFSCLIDKRTRGTNCSKCRKRIQPKIPISKNYSFLLEEWDYKLNKGKDPNKISEGSNVKVNWVCKNGHSYNMEPYYRTKQKLGCPICRGIKVNNLNSLEKLRPDLCEEWDFDKNNQLSPSGLTVGSNKLVWWKCKNGHSWKSTIINRSKKNGTQCPFCSGRTSSESTSLFTLYPKLIEEWDYERNNEITPSSVRPGSHKRVWWRCIKNPKHKWETPIYSRTSKGNFGCPYCSGKYVLREESIGEVSSKLMLEWDHNLNKGIDPFTLSPRSEKKVWWRCTEDKNHLWKTTISHRTEGTKCPYCTFTSILVRRYLKLHKLNLTDKIQLYYLIFFNEFEVFYKIGITKNSIEERYKSLYEKTGYKIVKVKVIKDSLQKIINLEQTLHRKVTRGLDVELVKYRPKIYFGGISECYNLPSSLQNYSNKLKTNYQSYKIISGINKI